MEAAEPVQTEYVSSIVLARETNKILRLCVSYRKRNAVAVRDTYPLPTMDECIDFLIDAQVFLSLETNSVFSKLKWNPRTL